MKLSEIGPARLRWAPAVIYSRARLTTHEIGFIGYEYSARRELDRPRRNGYDSDRGEGDEGGKTLSYDMFSSARGINAQLVMAYYWSRRLFTRQRNIARRL